MVGIKEVYSDRVSFKNTFFVSLVTLFIGNDINRSGSVMYNFEDGVRYVLGTIDKTFT